MADLVRNRVRTLTGKEIELDIEQDYKVGHRLHAAWTYRPSPRR